MVFSSLEFLAVFIPIFFTCYWAVPGHIKNLILLAGSLCFYLVGTLSHPGHMVLFLTCIILDFAVGIAIEEYRKFKKAFLAAGVVFHIGCLVLFKYLGFIFEQMGYPIPMSHFEDIVLPVGISFYTFQGISYLADVYRGTIKAEKSLIMFSVYISMFEQLIAGPIVTYSQVESALHDRKLTLPAVRSGIKTFILGLGLKVLLANPIGKLWGQVCSIGFESVSTPLAWMGIAAFSFQLYFDFFGYSLMSVGLGEMLGFQLPINFDFPYLSRSMTEFWRRWHITLGAWFREYVYIPLGGNRKGRSAEIRNLLVVWLLTGIWHGAGWNFLLWGAVLFLIQLLEKLLIGKYLNSVPALGHIYMLFLIPLTWSIFAIDSLEQWCIFFTRLFPVFAQGPWSVFRYDYLKYLQLYHPFFLAGVFFCSRLPFRLIKKLENRAVVWLPIFIILAASVYCLHMGMDDPFLYFRF